MGKELEIYTRWCIRCHKFKKMTGRSRGRRVCDECKKAPGRYGRKFHSQALRSQLPG